MDPVANHFELFGLPVEFSLDPSQLERAYRELQGKVHPDRFASASDAERRVAMQRATQANEAYGILKHPLRRAVHVLALRGVEVNPETGTRMQSEFLTRQLEWREAVEDARVARNIAALEDLLAQLQRDKRERYSMLENLLRTGADQPAAEAARQLMFIEKIEADIGDGIEALEAG